MIATAAIVRPDLEKKPGIDFNACFSRYRFEPSE